MASVVLHAVVSVDGFIAAPNDDVGPLLEWYFSGDMPIGGEAVEERLATFRGSPGRGVPPSEADGLAPRSRRAVLRRRRRGRAGRQGACRGPCGRGVRRQRRWAGAGAGPGGRGGDGRRTGGLRQGQEVLRPGRRPAPAGGSE